MNIYHGFFDLKPGAHDVEFAEDFAAFMEFLRKEGKLVTWRLTRRKLGLGPAELGEFHAMMEFNSLAQFDEAFSMAATRSGDMERYHFNVNSRVASVKFALYRDFPDGERQKGEELF